MSTEIAARPALSFTMNRAALRGLCGLTDKDATHYPGTQGIRLTGKGTSVYACATDGCAAGLWHQPNAGEDLGFSIHIPADVAKSLAKPGKKCVDVLIEVSDGMVKASSGGETVGHVLSDSKLYETRWPDRFLEVFRVNEALSYDLPPLHLDKLAMFSGLAKEWDNPAFYSQNMVRNKPVIVLFHGQPNFVGLVMPVLVELGEYPNSMPGWLSDLVNES